MTINVKTYGATGNGSTDDTAAIHAAAAAAGAAKVPLYFPAGTYSVTGLNLHYSSMRIQGDGKERTVIKSRAGYSSPTLRLATANPTFGPTNLTVQGIHFNGNGSNQAAVYALYLKTCYFKDCDFTHAGVGFHNVGGVLVRYARCQFRNNQYGYLLQGKFSTTADFVDCDAKDNSLFGVHIGEGRSVSWCGGSVESNGSKGAYSGGLFVDSTVGIGEGTSAPFLSRGVTFRDTWFEANKGLFGQVTMGGGVNTLDTCLFAAHGEPEHGPATITVSGGQYHLSNLLFENSKSPQVLEQGGVLAGNSIRDSFVGGYAHVRPILSGINTAKTTVGW